MNKIIGVLSLLLVSSYINSQPGWQWINPYPTGVELRSIKFINENTGFAVGAEGTFLKTVNGGVNWQIQTISSTNLKSVYFINEQTGFVCGENGLVMKTVSSGMYWITNTTNVTQTLNNIYFPSVNTGFIVGNTGTILKTTDTGESWDIVPSGFWDNLKQIQFLNAETGYLCSSSLIRKTTNGGINWVNQYSGSDLNSIYFVDSQNGHTCGDWGLFARTTNGGENWIEQIVISWCSAYSICFTDINNGYASAYIGTLYRTTDAGVSWFTVDTRTINYLYSVQFTNSQTGWIAGEVGCILRTTDGGNNWISQTGIKNTLLWMEFPSQTVGYICGGSGRVLITTNSGKNWHTSPTPVTSHLWKLRAVSENICYACTDSAMIKTTNKGLTWEKILTNYGLYDSFDFPDEMNGYTYGGSDYILRTTNGGSSWFQQPNGLSNSHIWPSYFVNPSTGFGSHYEKFYKTTNSGVNWTQLPLNIEILGEVYFLNSATGFLACGNGMIYKTVNTGLNWTVLKEEGPWLQKIVFPDINTGYALGDNDYIIKTTNGGINWVEIPRPITPELHDIDFLTPDEGFICGFGGAILKTSIGGIIVGSATGENWLPQSYSLSQNYPNPFNPVTKIKYDVPAVGQRHAFDVRLIIYDILGREIETLVNESQKPGSYEVTWDGSRFASGVYFYRLMTDNYSETKKMVLIK